MTEKEKTRRKSTRQLKSLRNKMGVHIAWFDSLNKTKQFDFLFAWIRRKSNTENKVKIIKTPISRTNGVSSYVFTKQYPPKLKHFIIEMKKSRMFTPSKSNFRQAVIDLILK